MLAEIRELLPYEPLLYVADQRFAPYGERTAVEVADRAVQITGQLIESGAKLVTVACNSASAVALHGLRTEYPHVPIVGMEPAVKPAAARSVSGVVGVLATATTFQGALFSSVVQRYANGAKVMPVVGAGLARLVEEGDPSGTVAKELVAGYLGPLVDAGMDTLVLGCTHYTFLTDTIRTVVGDRVEIIDPAPAVARQVYRVITDRALGALRGQPATMRLATTGDPNRFAGQVARLAAFEDEYRVHRW